MTRRTYVANPGYVPEDSDLEINGVDGILFGSYLESSNMTNGALLGELDNGRGTVSNPKKWISGDDGYPILKWQSP